MNRLTDDQIIYIPNCKNIQILYLTENLIQTISSLHPLLDLTHLKELDLTVNPIKYFPIDIFNYFSRLQILDRFTREGRDLEGFDWSSSDEDSEDSLVIARRVESESENSDIVFTPEEMKECDYEKPKPISKNEE